MRFFEYRSHRITIDEDRGHSTIEDTLNKWGKEGWEAISVVVPNPRNYSTYVVTAKREILGQRTPSTGRKFR